MSNKNEQQQLPTDVTENNLQSTNQYEVPNVEIKPLYLIRIIDTLDNSKMCSEKFIVLVIIGGKNPTRSLVELEQDDLIDQRAFNLKLGKSFVGVKITFPKFGLENFQKQLREQSVCKIQYSNAGHQIDGYIFGNAYFNYKTSQLITVPKYIPEKDYGCIENSLVDIKNPCIPMIFYSNRTPEDIIRMAMPQFAKTFNRFDVLICTGAALAISMRDVFMEIIGCMPSIFLFGAFESGKTTIMDFISGIYGFPDNSTHTAGDSTIYAISRSIHSRRNIPAFVDDMTIANLKKIEPIVKNIFSGISRERGKKDGIDKINVKTSLVVTANDFWSESSPQLLSRVLYANVKCGDFNLSEFEYHHPAQRKELSQILPLLLKYRTSIPNIYKNVYERICTLTKKQGKRHLFSIAISCTMWEIINHIVGQIVVDWQKIAIEYDEFYQKELVPDFSGADALLNSIAQMIENDKLDFNSDYTLTGESNLRLNLPKFVEKYNIYCSDRKGILTPKIFRRTVQTDSRFICNNTVPIAGIGRVISIDISKQEYLLEKVTQIKNRHVRFEPKQKPSLANLNENLPPILKDLPEITIPKPLEAKDIQNNASGGSIDG